MRIDMRRRVLFLVVAGVMVANIAYADQEIPANIVRLTDAEDLALAARFDAAINAVSSKITACDDSGQDAKMCQCKSAGLVKKLQETAGTILKNRPEWSGENVVLYWETKGEGGGPSFVSHNVVSGRILKAAEQTLAGCK